MGVVVLIKLKHEDIRNIDFAAVMAGIIAVFYGARAFIPKEVRWLIDNTEEHNFG